MAARAAGTINGVSVPINFLFFPIGKLAQKL